MPPRSAEASGNAPAAREAARVTSSALCPGWQCKDDCETPEKEGCQRGFHGWCPPLTPQYTPMAGGMHYVAVAVW